MAGRTGRPQLGHLLTRPDDANPGTAAVRARQPGRAVRRQACRPTLPAVAWHDLVALLPALAIAVIGYAESATVAEFLADEHGDTVRPDRELVAIGGANALAGLFQGFIAGGGASQSAANDRAALDA